MLTGLMGGLLFTNYCSKHHFWKLNEHENKTRFDCLHQDVLVQGMPLISPLLALLHLLSAAALPIYQVQLDPEKNPERNTFLVEIGF